MTQTPSAEELRQQMAQVRRDMNLNYGEVVDHAREMADWRYYVRSYPWAALGVALAAGYLVVPNRTEIISPNAEELLKLAKKNKLVVEPKPTAEPKSSVGGAVFTMLANLLVRGLISYAGQKMGKTAGRETAKAEQRAEAQSQAPRPT
jgi:hypothetical protein